MCNATDSRVHRVFDKPASRESKTLFERDPHSLPSGVQDLLDPFFPFSHRRTHEAALAHLRGVKDEPIGPSPPPDDIWLGFLASAGTICTCEVGPRRRSCAAEEKRVQFVTAAGCLGDGMRVEVV